MTVEVKICGLKSREMIDVAIDAGADYIGLVSFPKSPRHVELAAAAELAAHAQMRANVVVLVVDPTDAAIADIATEIGPDFVQLHGSESPDRVRDIAGRTTAKLIKAVPIATADDAARATDYCDAADMLLFDAKPAPGSDLPGGNGAAFDWQLVSGIDAPIPTMLSGGLTPDTVAGAIQQTGIGAVDVSSGVEARRGEKDAALIRAFVAAAKSL
ncbi:MAG: phosphoribosylanthranilate isomerase [Pseudomonadota bacterium]